MRVYTTKKFSEVSTTQGFDYFVRKRPKNVIANFST